MEFVLSTEQEFLDWMQETGNELQDEYDYFGDDFYE